MKFLVVGWEVRSRPLGVDLRKMEARFRKREGKRGYAKMGIFWGQFGIFRLPETTTGKADDGDQLGEGLSESGKT